MRFLADLLDRFINWAAPLPPQTRRPGASPDSTVCLLAGTWIGFGFGRESMRIDTDLASFLLTVPIDRHDQ